MTFDLAKLDTAKVAEEGAELRVAHPTTSDRCFGMVRPSLSDNIWKVLLGRLS